MREFKWLNESSITELDGRMTIHAPAESDFFNGHGVVAETGITPESLGNAPFYYTEIEGDFVLRVRVSHAFEDVYDACAIMVYEDELHWGKACYELTDFGTRAVVSVVTRIQSDDANGCNLDADSVWLQVCRVGDSFAFHYSLDGERFDMMRFFYLPVGRRILAGLVAQAPIGQGGGRHFEDLVIEERTVANIREGR